MENTFILHLKGKYEDMKNQKSQSKIILAGAIIASSVAVFNTAEANIYEAKEINTSKTQQLEILEACCGYSMVEYTDKELRRMKKQNKKWTKNWEKEQKQLAKAEKKNNNITAQK